MRYFIGFAATLLLFIGTFVGCNQPAENAVGPEIVDPVEATTVSFANTKCPIMGGKPKAELTAEYEGGIIGFCCDGCPEKWAALSDEEQAEKFASAADHAAHEDHDHSSHAEHSGE